MCNTSFFGYFRLGKQSEKSLPVEGCCEPIVQLGMASLCGGVLQAHCPAGHGGCLCYKVAGRVLGCSMQLTWVVPSSLGSEASADMVIVLPSVISCEEEGLMLQADGGSLSSTRELLPARSLKDGLL